MKKNHKIVIRRDCGFFSDFLTSLAGIMYCYDNNHNFHVDWMSNLYLTKDGGNLFDHYFNNQINSDVNFDVVHNNVTPYSYYYPKIVDLNTKNEIYDFLLPSHNLIHDLNILKSDFIDKIQTDLFLNKKVLGVHKRGTDHYLHGETIKNEEVMSYINNEFQKNSYDKIFLITDDDNSLEFFKTQLGDTLIYTDSTKVNGLRGVHTSGDIDKYKIAEEVITDAILLSLTDFKLLTKSNVSTFSNICNLKKDTFEYMDKFVKYV